jgi:AcrR family transcriptional regulator
LGWPTADRRSQSQQHTACLDTSDQLEAVRRKTRAIAEDAGVDPGLITHCFGTKDGLFAAALEPPVRPSEVFAGQGTLTSPEAVKLLVGIYLSLLDDTETRNPLLALIRSAVAQEDAARMVREFLTEEILAPIAATTDLLASLWSATWSGSKFSLL